MSARADLPVGTVLGGRFRVEGKLGAGTMGTVYEVEHVLTRHRRALKLLDPELRAHRETWERFRREASIAARIESPRVVSVFDAGELPEGDAYVLMELLEGESMASLLSRRAPLPVGEIAGMVREAALGLHAAHEAGIVHRDVKPANLFVCSDGRLKVLDFGICRFDADLTQLESRTVDPSSLGTPSFMSPEQVRGVRDLDRRVDVWALGVLLYVGVVGDRPFRAGSLPELAVAIDRGRREPLPSTVPPALAAVIDRAMAVERDERFPTAAALADALSPFLAETATLDPRATLHPRETLDPRELSTIEPPKRSRRGLFFGLAAVIGLGSILAFVSTRSTATTTAAASVLPSIAPSPSIVPSAVLSPAVSVSASAPKTPPAPALPLHRDNPYR